MSQSGAPPAATATPAAATPAAAATAGTAPAPNPDANKEFLCNTFIIKALLQFMPLSERKKVQEWLTKLHEVQTGANEMKTRDEYSFYLLINLQNGIMSQPFNRGPPPGKLKPLCRILPDFLYEDVMKQLQTSYCRLNKLLNDNSTAQDPDPLGCVPDKFLEVQPFPRKGLTAFCAVFSNYEDDEPKTT